MNHKNDSAPPDKRSPPPPSIKLDYYGSNPSHKDQVPQENGAIIQPAER